MNGIDADKSLDVGDCVVAVRDLAAMTVYSDGGMRWIGEKIPVGGIGIVTHTHLGSSQRLAAVDWYVPRAMSSVVKAGEVVLGSAHARARVVAARELAPA